MTRSTLLRLAAFAAALLGVFAVSFAVGSAFDDGPGEPDRTEHPHQLEERR